MDTTPEVNKNAVRKKKQAVLRAKKHLENPEAWDGEFKEFKEEAVSKQHRKIDIWEEQEQ